MKAMHMTALLVFLLVSNGTLATADTLVSMSSDPGGTTEIWIGDERARLSGGQEPGYMLFDIANNKQYVVNDEDKMIIEMSEMPQGMMIPPGMDRQARPQAEVTVAKKGSGPKIAGFSTTRYEIKVNGQLCFEEYLSDEVLDNQQLKRFYTAMQDLRQDQEMPMLNDPCAPAMTEMDKRYPKLGLPMRTVGADGQVTHEVTALKTGLSAPDGAYDFPNGYQKVSMKEMMQQMMQNVPGGMMMEGNP